MKKGLTFVELMMSIVMLAVLLVVTVYVFHAVLLIWSSQETRVGIDISLDRGIHELVLDMREAAEVSSVNSDELRFTLDGSNYYIYYFYHPSDSYPLAFSQAAYDLKRALLTGGINGVFVYGSGKYIATGVLPPATSDLSFNGSIVTIDLTVEQGEETMRSKTAVRARNL